MKESLTNISLETDNHNEHLFHETINFLNLSIASFSLNSQTNLLETLSNVKSEIVGF